LPRTPEGSRIRTRSPLDNAPRARIPTTRLCFATVRADMPKDYGPYARIAHLERSARCVVTPLGRERAKGGPHRWSGTVTQGGDTIREIRGRVGYGQQLVT